VAIADVAGKIVTMKFKLSAMALLDSRTGRACTDQQTRAN
jgi:hypothetical protein